MLRVVVVLCIVATTAHAEPWYRGRHGKNRVVHVALAGTLVALEPLALHLESSLAPARCDRWCDPTTFDRRVRDALRWDDGSSARTLSNVSAYVLAPGVALSMVALGTLTTPGTRALIDDAVPILEAVLVTHWVTTAAKVAIGRQRPYAHYGVPEGVEDNLSFPSGHTSFSFAFATAAGRIAHDRGYRAEPYIWATGLLAASAAGYFRIAADRHYVTDVLAGAVLGSSIGLTVPLLMRRNHIEVVPTRGGVAFAGTW